MTSNKTSMLLQFFLGWGHSGTSRFPPSPPKKSFVSLRWKSIWPCEIGCSLPFWIYYPPVSFSIWGLSFGWLFVGPLHSSCSRYRRLSMELGLVKCRDTSFVCFVYPAAVVDVDVVVVVVVFYLSCPYFSSNIGPWWWSSGQHFCLLLQWSKLESCWLLKFSLQKDKKEA